MDVLQAAATSTILTVWFLIGWALALGVDIMTNRNHL